MHVKEKKTTILEFAEAAKNYCQLSMHLNKDMYCNLTAASTVEKETLDKLMEEEKKKITRKLEQFATLLKESGVCT